MSTIAVDFDGTISTGCTFPVARNGYPSRFLIWWLKHRRSRGDRVILWTCRENYGGKWYPDGNYLDDALSYCRTFGLEFDAVNPSGIVEFEDVSKDQTSFLLHKYI